MTVDTNGTPGKRGAPPKADFDVTTALDADGGAVVLDSGGRLTTVPENWDASFKPLTQRAHFATKSTYCLFKALEFDLKAESSRAKAEEWREKSEEADTPASPEAKKQRAKKRAAKALGIAPTDTPEQALAKMADLLAALNS